MDPVTGIILLVAAAFGVRWLYDYLRDRSRNG